MKQHLLTLFTALLPILVSAGPVEINGIWYNLDTEAITAEVTRNPNIEAFMYCSSFTTIRIPVGVTSIGDWAFYKGSNLTSITIPESMATIGYRASAIATTYRIYTVILLKRLRQKTKFSMNHIPKELLYTFLPAHSTSIKPLLLGVASAASYLWRWTWMPCQRSTTNGHLRPTISAVAT